MSVRPEEVARILARAERAEQEIHKAQGALQAREQEREKIRRECSSLGIDPDHIDEELLAVEAQLDEETRKLRAQVEDAERALGGNFGNSP